MTLTIPDLLADANKFLKRRGSCLVLSGTIGRSTLVLVHPNLEQTTVIEGTSEHIKVYLAAFTTGFKIGATK
jgi:hypothetical protein